MKNIIKKLSTKIVFGQEFTNQSHNLTLGDWKMKNK
jgi:hypothetical protein